MSEPIDPWEVLEGSFEMWAMPSPEYEAKCRAALTTLRAQAERQEAAIHDLIDETRAVAADIAGRPSISTTAAAGRLLDVTDSLRSILSPPTTTDEVPDA